MQVNLSLINKYAGQLIFN